MRIIAGELKGRRLKTPYDDRVRPTTDKVKEAVFSMISPYLYDSVAVDLFAGTGNLGLEAISRGARRVYFADKDRRSIALVRENTAYCRVEDRSVILWSDYRDALLKIEDPVDIIFLDPPYGSGFLEDALEMIASCGILSDGGIVVAEYAVGEELPDSFGALSVIKKKKYGKIGISVYENAVVSEAE